MPQMKQKLLISWFLSLDYSLRTPNVSMIIPTTIFIIMLSITYWKILSKNNRERLYFAVLALTSD